MRQPRSTAPAGCDLAAAFPYRRAEDVRAVLAVMPEARIAPAAAFAVRVDDEAVAIPYRIYPEEPPAELVHSLTDVRQSILHCLYSRHSDGFVRQRHLRHIVDSAEPWVVPFVVQLVGEYVVEIIESIKDGLTDLTVAGSVRRLIYAGFLARNPEFFAVTERRVVSYWNCYYRSRFPDFRTYPAHDLLELLWTVAGDGRSELSGRPRGGSGGR